MIQKLLIILFLPVFLLPSCRNRSDQAIGGAAPVSKQTQTAPGQNPGKPDGSAEIQPEEVITDIEGNEYPTIRIGNQTWFLKNLKTTKYNDGKPVTLVSDGAAWAGLSKPAFCWYENDSSSFKPTYGALYNGYAVNSGKLCPKDWHVPTNDDWRGLISYLGGESVAGGKMKAPGTSFWVGPNTGATNESGFNALPGGLRYHDGSFHDFGFSGYWWSSTLLSNDRAFFIYLDYEYADAFRFDNLMKIGFSVRCIKDH